MCHSKMIQYFGPRNPRFLTNHGEIQPVGSVRIQRRVHYVWYVLQFGNGEIMLSSFSSIYRLWRMGKRSSCSKRALIKPNVTGFSR